MWSSQHKVSQSENLTKYEVMFGVICWDGLPAGPDCCSEFVYNNRTNYVNDAIEMPFTNSHPAAQEGSI